jgi:mannose-6-phosphate isomerase
MLIRDSGKEPRDILYSRIALLKNEIKEYPWGSWTFIPDLTGMPSPSEHPQAEMWMGAHPGASSLAVMGDRQTSLGEIIKNDPEGVLGRAVAGKFHDRLPFLFKVLSAARPLSIQAHPNKEQADKGFARENFKGIPIDSPERNYRDPNHKPELICALTQMWALKGFRRKEEIIELVHKVDSPSLISHGKLLRTQGEKNGLKSFFVSLLVMDKEGQKSIVEEVIGKVNNLETAAPVFDWMKKLFKQYPGDIGVLSPLFLNLISLEPSEAIYISSGELHGYLEGSGLEIMANSDNVIRGGLTSKHIDVPELINILNFTSRQPEIISPVPCSNNESFYYTGNEEFILSVISLPGSETETSFYRAPVERSAEIIICTGGKARVEGIPTGDIIDVSKGTTFFIPASVEGYIISGDATLYKAATPLS